MRLIHLFFFICCFLITACGGGSSTKAENTVDNKPPKAINKSPEITVEYPSAVEELDELMIKVKVATFGSQLKVSKLIQLSGVKVTLEETDDVWKGTVPILDSSGTLTFKIEAEDKAGLTSSKLITVKLEKASRISEIAFSDPIFEKCVNEHAEKQSWVLVKQVESVACFENGLKTLGGIEKLSQLKALFVQTDSKITDLDLSHNIALEHVAISAGVEHFTFPELKNLKVLDLLTNPLKSVNISSSTDLEKLILNSNKLEELDLLPFEKLKWLELSVREANPIGQSEINTLELAHMPELTYLKVKRMKLETLDLSHNLKLEDITLDITSVKTLDVANLKQLRELNINNSQVERMDLSHNAGLKSVYFVGNRIKKINFDHNLELYYISLYRNPLLEETKQYLEELKKTRQGLTIIY